jgi:UDP-galactopyranose mutase
MKYDFLIVGAGFSGSILAERIASVLSMKSLVIDRRDHIGGNCYDYVNDNGILVHKYGPHAFHTVNQKVIAYLSKFTKWIDYEHMVQAEVENRKIPIPFNLNSLRMCFDKNKADIIEKTLIESYGFGNKVPILTLMNTDSELLKELAEYVYQHVFLGYTLKQWGMKPEELGNNVTGRIPVVISHDNRYFHDTFQKMPDKGYTEMIGNILSNDNITIKLNTDYEQVNCLNCQFEYNSLIWTGPIDRYFNYKYGRLPYRSLRFELSEFDYEFHQETAQLNFPESQPYTRTTEFKHFYNTNSERTTVAYEYPEEYTEGLNEPYYPIPKSEFEDMYSLYSEEAEKLKGKVYFVGRLADYKYYNMDQVVGVALQFFDKQIKPKFSDGK